MHDAHPEFRKSIQTPPALTPYTLVCEVEGHPPSKVIAVEGNVISDISEYQDSYGFILEAKKQSALLKPAEASAISSKIEELQALWVDGVLPPPQPTSASQVAKKVRDAIKELKEIQNVSAKR